MIHVKIVHTEYSKKQKSGHREPNELIAVISDRDDHGLVLQLCQGSWKEKFDFKGNGGRTARYSYVGFGQIYLRVTGGVERASYMSEVDIWNQKPEGEVGRESLEKMYSQRPRTELSLVTPLEGRNPSSAGTRLAGRWYKRL